MPKPKFVTFTGVDEKTSVGDLLDISSRYPVEWGVLFSSTNRGNRYITAGALASLIIMSHKLNLSAHLCGRLSSDFQSNGHHLSAIWQSFKRIQVNMLSNHYDYDRLDALALDEEELGMPQIIVQHRHGPFPTNKGVYLDYLHDCSGGRGLEPDSLPAQNSMINGPVFCGYSGGISPDNVLSRLEEIPAREGEFWIDMESSVRDNNDRFSTQRCLRVCEAIWGER